MVHTWKILPSTFSSVASTVGWSPAGGSSLPATVDWDSVFGSYMELMEAAASGALP